MILIPIAEAIGKLFYLLTAYLPRRLPTTPEQYERFKNVLIGCYGVPDTDISWITVAGQITSTPATQIRKSWGSIANAAKRVRINTLANAQSLEAKKAKFDEDQAKTVANQKKQHEINTVIEAHFTRDPGGPGAFLSKDFDESELIDILEDEFPGEGSRKDWIGYIKYWAGETLSKQIKEQSNGHKDSQEQQASNGDTVQAQTSVDPSEVH